LEIEFLKITPIRIKRILTTFLILLLAFLITFIGTVTPMTQEKAETTRRELEKFERIPDEFTFQLIFGNNFYLCLLMFLPFLGPILGFYVLYNTGQAIGAIAITRGFNPAAMFITLFIFPFAWMEYIAYSIAISQSFWLTLSIFRRRFKVEFLKTCIFIVLCAIILIIAALIETILLISIPKT
jgi:uncharacterized membrane protein SpoIIM required for sporulation